MDVLTKEQRSYCMSRIRSKDTAPELAVRRTLSEMGIRYRLHVKKLPGTPDIVIAKRKMAIFVNGCFWHQHRGCKWQSIPKTNNRYWQGKLLGNVERQKHSLSQLKELGWKVVVLWECEISNRPLLKRKLVRLGLTRS